MNETICRHVRQNRRGWVKEGPVGGRGTRGVLRSPGRWQTMKCGQETLSAKSALSIYMYMYVGIFCLHIYAWPIDDV